MLIVEETIRGLQWHGFWERNARDDYFDILQDIWQLKTALNIEDIESSKDWFTRVKSTIRKFQADFENVVMECADRSEMCQFWSVFIQIVDSLKLLFSADREED